MKVPGKPDAGEPPVRFDEGRGRPVLNAPDSPAYSTCPPSRASLGPVAEATHQVNDQTDEQNEPEATAAEGGAADVKTASTKD